MGRRYKMKTSLKSLRETVDVCHGSRIYPFLNRQEKRDAVIYCLRIIEKIREKRGG
jgi:hypothetical protein